MKLCIPVIEDRGFVSTLSDHFGSAPYFAIYDCETTRLSLVGNHEQTHPHGTCNPAGSLTSSGVQSVLCRGMGRRAVSMLAGLGIQVLLVTVQTVEEAVAQYMAGACSELSADKVCPGHATH